MNNTVSVNTRSVMVRHAMRIIVTVITCAAYEVISGHFLVVVLL